MNLSRRQFLKSTAVAGAAAALPAAGAFDSPATLIPERWLEKFGFLKPWFGISVTLPQTFKAPGPFSNKVADTSASR